MRMWFGKARRVAAAVTGILVLLAGAGSAVIIETGDGSGNTTGPVPDPNWDYAGLRSGNSAVYLGDGWVLTAGHVAAGNVNFGGMAYPNIPGVEILFQNPDETDSDLLLFAIDPYPVVPLLPIATSPPAVDTPLVMAGQGRNRATGSITWMGVPGFDWAAGKTLRWGTNHLEGYPAGKTVSTFGETWSFYTNFVLGDSAHEAQGATGDSGGAVFAWNAMDMQWELVGIIHAIATYVDPDQPAETSLQGQLTFAADLSFYADDILDIIDLPEPVGALPAGLALLMTLARRRRGRSVASCSADRRAP